MYSKTASNPMTRTSRADLSAVIGHVKLKDGQARRLQFLFGYIVMNDIMLLFGINDVGIARVLGSQFWIARTRKESHFVSKDGMEWKWKYHSTPVRAKGRIRANCAKDARTDTAMSSSRNNPVRYCTSGTLFFRMSLAANGSSDSPNESSQQKSVRLCLRGSQCFYGIGVTKVVP